MKRLLIALLLLLSCFTCYAESTASLVSAKVYFTKDLMGKPEAFVEIINASPSPIVVPMEGYSVGYSIRGLTFAHIVFQDELDLPAASLTKQFHPVTIEAGKTLKLPFSCSPPQGWKEPQEVFIVVDKRLMSKLGISLERIPTTVVPHTAAESLIPK